MIPNRHLRLSLQENNLIAGHFGLVGLDYCSVGYGTVLCGSRVQAPGEISELCPKSNFMEATTHHQLVKH